MYPHREREGKMRAQASKTKRKWARVNFKSVECWCNFKEYHYEFVLNLIMLLHQ